MYSICYFKDKAWDPRIHRKDGRGCWHSHNRQLNAKSTGWLDYDTADEAEKTLRSWGEEVRYCGNCRWSTG